LRNAGAGALGLAFGAAFAGSLGAESAFGHGTASHPCGPSPLAASGYCNNGNCNIPSACTRRYYNTYTCAPGNASNCWTEDYRSSGKGLWRCCDICANNGTGPRCSGSCGLYGHHAAICRTKIG
jgi:hypothetical protein